MDELRRRVIEDLSAGIKVTDIMAKFRIARSTVYNIKKLYDETGGYKKRENGGRPRTACTEEKMTLIKETLEANPVMSFRKLALEMTMSTMSVWAAVRELGEVSRAIIKKPRLTQATREKRLERSKVLLNLLKKGKKGPIIFSDEKFFLVDRVINSRNHRYIAFVDPEDVPDEIKYCPVTKNAQGVMVLGAVSTDGNICPPVFIPQGLKVNAQVYQDLLKQHILPWLEATYPLGDYTWQQDGALAHTAKTTQKFLETNMANFWSKEVWPPSSPDLSVLDFFWWGVVAERSNSTSHPNLDSLKASIVEAWGQIPRDSIIRATSSFRARLEKCVAAEGRHFE